MKISLLTVTSLLTFMLSASAFSQEVDPVLPGPPTKPKIDKLSLVPIDEVFVPGGFDDNDVTEVVVKGTLPNSCWSVADGMAKYDEASKTYQISVASYVLQNQICLPVTSTFIQTVKLGAIQAGQYTVKADTPSQEFVTKTLNVAHANTSRHDNFLYAQVESIHLLKDAKQSFKYEIQGRIPPMNEKCLELDRVETIYDSEDVLTVLPILKEVQPDSCTPEEILHGRSFNKRLEEIQTPTKDFLIHVRSINGQSVIRYVPEN